MKFTLALVGAAAATSQQGIQMLQKLNTMDQSIENMENVKVALVQCAAAGDCSVEAAAMPNLALATNSTAPASNDSDLHKWEACYKSNGSNAAATKTCAKEQEAAFNGNAVKYLTAKVEVDCAVPSYVKDGKLVYADNATTAEKDELKVKYEAHKTLCKVTQEELKVAKSGDLPWIIVGSVVGLICVGGAVICYCRRDKDEDSA